MSYPLLSYWAGVALIVLAGPLSADLILVQDGTPTGVIYVAADASEQAKEASVELQTFIRRMSGAEIPITSHPQQGIGSQILVGNSEQARKMEPYLPSGRGPSLDEEGFVIRCEGDTLLLAGNETPPYQGTYFAVYEFLERLGCRWFFPGGFGEVIPRKNRILFPATEVRMKPDFRVRDLWYSGNMPATEDQKKEFVTWKRRNKFSTRGYDGFGPGLLMPPYTTEGNCLQFPEDGSARKLLPQEKYFETHPEYYSLNQDGSRNPRMPCMTHPGAAAAAIEEIDLYFTQHPEAFAYAFSPPDAQAMCYCADCIQAAHGGFGGEGKGNVSDVYYAFVDRIAREVKARFPDRWVGTLAYHDRFRPPQGLSGKWSNVYLMMAAIQNCSLHGYDKTGCPLSEQVRSLAEKWSRQATALLYYDYDPFNWTRLQTPAWDSVRIARDLRWLKNHNGWGFTVESVLDYTSLGLNHYLRGQLGWDVDRDIETILKDFCTHFFGPASEPMRSYYQRIDHRLDSSPFHLESGMSDLDTRMALWNEDLVEEAENYLSKAENLATGNPYRMRVAAFRAGFDNLKAVRASHAAASRGDFAEAARQADRMREIAQNLQQPMFLLNDGSGWLGAQALHKFYTGLAEKTSASGSQILSVFPTRADFRPDPVPKGLIFEWYRPDLEVGKEWQRIRLDQSWDVQGVISWEGLPYTGTAWYRVGVDLPAEVSTQKVYLLFPALKASDVWVWVNGKLAGHSKVTGDAGTDIDLSGRLAPGRNLIAVRVSGGLGERHTPFSGFGGIALPPVLYRAAP